MGIYLPNMEMPTSCGQCPFHDEDYRGKEHCDIGWKMIGKAEEKPDWCPLISVPPHGDLIERDALLYEFPAPIEDEYKIARRIISAAPTIIPASKEGE